MTDSLNPIQVQEFLRGLDYPVGKPDLVAAARDQAVAENVVRAVEAIPNRSYDAPTDVSEAIVHAGQHPEDTSGRGAAPEKETDDDDERSGERFDAG